MEWGRFIRLHKFSLLLLISGLLFYSTFAYDLEREDFIKLFMLYCALFFISWKMIQLEKVNFWFLVGAGFLFRVIFIASAPNLSQDFYRFIWDGRMLIEGFNPYIYLPQELMANATAPIAGAPGLYNGMGTLSAGNYTNYPPLNQMIFAFASLLAGKSILGSLIVIRVIIMAADIGVLYFGKKLLESLHLPGHRIFWYILNPLVIIELTGNLHIEGVMVFFLLLAVYLLKEQKWVGSAVAMAASVLLKLIPLIFLPFLLFYFSRSGGSKTPLGLPRLIAYYIIVGLIVILGFLPFYSPDFLHSYSSSIGLWFQSFEFNASFYYLVRWIGFLVKGYNIIETAGRLLPVIIVLIFAAMIFFRRKGSLQELITSMLFAATVYFFFSTTVHPWYLITPLLLCVFTTYRFMLLWSFLVILSYFTYATPEYNENLGLVAVQYLLVIGYFGWEIFERKKSQIEEALQKKSNSSLG